MSINVSMKNSKRFNFLISSDKMSSSCRDRTYENDVHIPFASFSGITPTSGGQVGRARSIECPGTFGQVVH